MNYINVNHLVRLYDVQGEALIIIVDAVSVSGTYPAIISIPVMRGCSMWRWDGCDGDRSVGEILWVDSYTHITGQLEREENNNVRTYLPPLC